MTLRAKMLCQSVTDTGFADNVRLTPVWTDGKNSEDNTYAKATPAGELTLQIDNPTARGFIKPQKKYYVTITEASE